MVGIEGPGSEFRLSPFPAVRSLPAAAGVLGGLCVENAPLAFRRLPRRSSRKRTKTGSFRTLHSALRTLHFF